MGETPNLPERWDFAMDFLGNPEAEEVQAYVDALSAQLTEKDREIERLKVDSKTLNELGHALGRCYCTDSGCYTAEPEHLMERVQELTAKERMEWDWDLMRQERDEALAQLSASQAREREAREEARINLESAKAEAIDRDAMLARAMQAEAREREAVEFVEPCRNCHGTGQDGEPGDGIVSDVTWTCEDCGGSGIEKEPTRIRVLSALAAARKALDELLGQFTQPCHPGEPAMSAMVPTRELDRYRAALNGDSHA